MQSLDVDVAVATATSLMSAGHQVTARAAQRIVRRVRAAAEFSVEPVMALTGFDGTHGPDVELGDSDVLVLDRPSWVRANMQSMPALLGINVIRDGVSTTDHQRPSALAKTAATALGVQMGGVMGFVATRVLGQFDPYTALPDPVTGKPIGPAGGRLMLIAPNMAATARELRVRPNDFYRWVCLHETTHRLQFNVAPWLTRFMQDKITELVELIDNPLSSVALSGPGANHQVNAVLSRVTGVMSLLEGHANYIMDDVSADKVRSVETIRKRFDERSANDSLLVRVLKKVLGLNMKAAQYKNGQRFVTHVVDEIGMAGFNQVWQGPEFLPSEDEVLNPELWVQRVRAIA